MFRLARFEGIFMIILLDVLHIIGFLFLSYNLYSFSIYINSIYTTRFLSGFLFMGQFVITVIRGVWNVGRGSLVWAEFVKTMFGQVDLSCGAS